MKLKDIKSPGFNPAEWEAKGYQLPKFDVEAVARKTHDQPTWVHFGGGNIFRAFLAAMLNDLLNEGKYDRGLIVAGIHDYEVLEKVFFPYDNLTLLVSLKASGAVEKKGLPVPQPNITTSPFSRCFIASAVLYLSPTP